ncbi:unnamed protein product [Linum trigynum]|uniref:Uncharacterized protein n=1 Tax=Linum trigynum TaxID=586398 RepID=A0AAV2DWG2_9ROSI
MGNRSPAEKPFAALCRWETKLVEQGNIFVLQQLPAALTPAPIGELSDDDSILSNEALAVDLAIPLPALSFFFLVEPAASPVEGKH